MTYFLLFLISFLISLAVVWLARFFGGKFQFFDLPKEDPQKIKIHQKPIPFLGGLAMFLAFSILFFALSCFYEFFDWKIGGILFAAFLIFFVGFFDDLKWKNYFVKPKIKLFFLILFSFLAALILTKAGIKIQFLESIIAGFILTFFYILALINVIDFQDGIDGLAGGMTVISLLGFIVISLSGGNLLPFLISLILLGAVLGFLIFNFPPASIFMGDSGAYFLGFFLAVLAIFFSQPHNIFSIFGPILIIGLPIFDTAYVIIKRVLEKKSPIVGDRDHFYDVLHFKKGFSVKKTLLICYFIQVILVAGGLFFIYI